MPKAAGGDSSPEHSNPYQEFTSPTALVGHIIGQDPTTVAWQAVAEQAITMEGQDGAGSLSVMALDRHLRATEAPRMATEMPNIDEAALYDVASRLGSVVGRGSQVAEELEQSGRRLAGVGDETVMGLRSVTGRLEDVAGPGAIGSWSRIAETLEQVLAYHKIQQLEDISSRLGASVSRLENGPHRW
jgi:hypothetical protein